MGDVMEKYELEEYYILSVKQIRLKDDEGEYWYPIRSFFEKVLFRNFNVPSYRDNPIYSKFMKVISYEHPDTAAKGQKTKTWFINQEGMCLILNNVKSISDTPKKYMMREKYLMEARIFFNVRTISDSKEFLSYTPDLSNYDVWSAICITRDKSINEKTLWKRCHTCGYYYPYTKRYFNKLKTQLSGSCKQCLGSDFICKNKHIQYLHNHDGLDLLYELYENKDDNKILEELKKWLRKGGI